MVKNDTPSLFESCYRHDDTLTLTLCEGLFESSDSHLGVSHDGSTEASFASIKSLIIKTAGKILYKENMLRSN